MVVGGGGPGFAPCLFSQDIWRVWHFQIQKVGGGSNYPSETTDVMLPPSCFAFCQPNLEARPRFDTNRVRVVELVFPVLDRWGSDPPDFTLNPGERPTPPSRTWTVTLADLQDVLGDGESWLAEDVLARRAARPGSPPPAWRRHRGKSPGRRARSPWPARPLLPSKKKVAQR